MYDKEGSVLRVETTIVHPREFRIYRLFGEKSFETVCFDPFILKQALKRTRSVCLRAF
jgi:hypothetical protein